MTAGPTGNAASLHAALAALEVSGADRFNPVRFGFIKAMAKRCLEQRESVANLVANKALRALEKYQSELLSEQADAEPLVKQVASSHPEAAEQVQSMFDAHDFRGVRRLAAPKQRPTSEKALIGLLELINGEDKPGIDQRGPAPISELLSTQEADAVRSLSSADTTPSAQQTPGELKAVRYFRETLQRQHADELVSRAVTEAPADSGPLNPQKLAIQSLAAMRELSPAYLARFVSYVDTLFWLENTGKSNKS